MHLFMTGASGSVGLEVLRALRSDTRFDRVTCLMRGSPRDTAAERWHSLVTRHALLKDAAEPGPQIEFVEGDLCAADFAMDASARAQLAASVTHILHAAAHIRFDAPNAVAHAINVGGTQRVLEFAQQCARLHNLAHVSTLYVVGTRQGKLPEDAVPEDSFNNEYERTKYEAELLVRASGLPMDIYRLALLQGRAEDGYVHHYLESHMLMDAFCRGTCPMLPGRPGASLDMLPTDYTAQAIVRLIAEHPPTGRIWSIAAGDAAPSITQLYQAISDGLRDLGKPTPPSPRHIDAAALQHILASDDPHEHGMSPGACAILEIVGAYLLRPKIYTPSKIPGMPPPPPAMQWLKPVLAHCFATGWGRRALASA